MRSRRRPSQWLFPGAVSLAARRANIRASPEIVDERVDLAGERFCGLLLAQVDNEQVAVALLEACALAPLELERQGHLAPRRLDTIARGDDRRVRVADVGVEASLTGLNDIASPAGKIAGSAQKRLAGGAVLHHVTMAYDIDADKMLQVLRIGREKLSDKGTRSANKRVDPVRSQTRLPREQVIDAFLAHFRGRYRTVDDELRPAELERALHLVETKFSDPAWTARVP